MHWSVILLISSQTKQVAHFLEQVTEAIAKHGFAARPWYDRV
jgi:hypothetical protein